MAYLVDTNCFVRLAEQGSPGRSTVLRALSKLHASGESLCVTPQVIGEFWNVCPRPTSARGGLGLDIASTDRKVRLIERHFRLLPDNLATFVEWRRLLLENSIQGVQVHDARIVASMAIHNISHLLTFNTSDFRRFAGTTVIDPSDV